MPATQVSHTPGPWRVAGITTPTGNDIGIRGQTDTVIALALAGPNREPDANARLIAAAPDLLAACEWAFLELQVWLPKDPSDRAASGLETIAAAIAKATPS